MVLGGSRTAQGVDRTTTVGAVTTQPDLGQLRDLAVDVASEAGELLGRGLDAERTDVSTKSTSTDMVTEMDERSELLVVERIRARRPHDAIVGEEGTQHSGTSGVTWVIDPLDGTTNYLYRLSGWNVSIGAEIDGRPVAGAVAVPGDGEIFAAARGLGATCNGASMTVAAPAPLEQALIGTGFSYEPDIRARQARALVALLPAVRDIRRRGAAATDLCAVAAGRLDAYYESGLARWDRSAGRIIAEEAGARVETLDAGPIGVLTVAAHPERFDELLELLERCGATDRGVVNRR